MMVSSWCCWGSSVHVICIGLAETGGGDRSGIPCVLLLWALFAWQMSYLVAVVADLLYTWQPTWPLMYGFDPHPGQIASCWLHWVIDCYQCCLITKTVLVLALFISLRCVLVAYIGYGSVQAVYIEMFIDITIKRAFNNLVPFALQYALSWAEARFFVSLYMEITRLLCVTA